MTLRFAAGRVLAVRIVSEIEVPGFDRATMDGYAVLADNTEGAAAYSRIPLTVIGDAMPGSAFRGSLADGQTVRVMTGAPLPSGSDAVLAAEWVDTDSSPRRGASRVCAGQRLTRQKCRQAWRRHCDRYELA